MSKFHSDRDRNRAAEYLIVAFLLNLGIPAFVNPAADPDEAPDHETHDALLREREAYDIGVGYPQDPWELWEVKTDWYSFRSKNVCIEAPTLEHTRASRIVYLFPRPSSVYFHTLTVQEAVDLYNAQIRMPNGMTRYTYPHKNVGDGGRIPAVLVPQEVLQTVGQNLWAVTRELQQVTQAA